MKGSRRKFLVHSGILGLSTASGLPQGFPSFAYHERLTNNFPLSGAADETLSIIGQYGPWVAALNAGKLPSLSFRNSSGATIDSRREAAKKRVTDRLAIPTIEKIPQVTVTRQLTYDGLQIEELSWQLPYGRPTAAILLKPDGAKGRLPAILAFHDHGGNKYFGTQKITRTGDHQHPLIKDHQKEYYSGLAWANEIARKGYVVLVSDAFTFASRRIWFQDVPAHLRDGHDDHDADNPANIESYNAWAAEHEHVMAKSLFSAGTTWPGVFTAEDRIALDILCARKDVDSSRIGCGGLSGGGLRTVFMGGLDERIKCAVCVGFMTTWKDFVLYKSYTHTWMTYVPVLPNELEFPEILGLRAPLPTLVLNDSDDGLYTLPEMKKADKILGEVYKKAGALDHYHCSYYPGPHKFDADMQKEAFAWFDRWLKN